MLYDGPFALNEVAGQPVTTSGRSRSTDSSLTWTQVGRVLTPDMRGASAQGETVATVDETLGLGRLSPNGAETAQGEWVDVRRRLLAALALEAVGIGSKAIELALAYVSDREQFGKKIGSYQAISHSLVDGYVAVELSRSLAYWAAWCVAERRRAGRSRGRRGEVAGRRGRGARLREVDPGARRHRLHLGAPAASLLQASAVARKRARLRSRAPRGDRRIPSVVVTGTSTGIGAATAAHLRDTGWTVYASVRRAGEAPPGTTELVFDVADAEGIAAAAAAVESLDARRRQRGHRDRVPARVPAAGRADAPARRQRRRSAARAAGVSACAAEGAGPHRPHGLDRRALGAPVPRRLRDVEVRAGGDGGRAARRARPVRAAGRHHRARDDRHADLVEAAARRRRASGRCGRAVRTASGEVPCARCFARLRRQSRRSRWRRPSNTRSARAKPKTRYVVGPDAKRRARVQMLPDRLRDRVLTRYLFGS